MKRVNSVVHVNATPTELDQRIADAIVRGNAEGKLLVTALVTCPTEALVVFVEDAPETKVATQTEVEPEPEPKPTTVAKVLDKFKTKAKSKP